MADLTPAQIAAQRMFVKAKRKRLFDALVRQGIPESKARRMACAVHKTSTQKTEKQKPTVKQDEPLWLPPLLRAEMRRQMTPVDRVAHRLMTTLHMTSTAASRLAAQTFRDNDARAGA
jgi:hypothetical protein